VSIAIPSPCIRVCKLDPGLGICTGCGRNMAEISAWPRATPEQRAAILAAALERRVALP
jgi:predicted Fe-S protein YdhL (DUF1289 family)